MLKWIKLYGTTTAGGALTKTANVSVRGMLKSIEWIDGDFDNGVDAVLSLVRDDDAADITLLTLTNADNDAIYNPRYIAHDATGTAVTYDGTNEIYVEQFLNGTLKLVVASGGNAKTGGCIVYYEG